MELALTSDPAFYLESPFYYATQILQFDKYYGYLAWA
jgi:hypothetical protein